MPSMLFAEDETPPLREDKGKGKAPREDKGKGKASPPPTPKVTKRGRVSRQVDATHVTHGPGRASYRSGEGSSSGAGSASGARGAKKFDAFSDPEKRTRRDFKKWIVACRQQSRHEVRMRIVRQIEMIPVGNHRAVFGLAPDEAIDEEMLQHTVHNMSRLLHPDKLQGIVDLDIIERIAVAFQRMQDAHEALDEVLHPEKAMRKLLARELAAAGKSSDEDEADDADEDAADEAGAPDEADAGEDEADAADDEATMPYALAAAAADAAESAEVDAAVAAVAADEAGEAAEATAAVAVANPEDGAAEAEAQRVAAETLAKAKAAKKKGGKRGGGKRRRKAWNSKSKAKAERVAKRVAMEAEFEQPHFLVARDSIRFADMFEGKTQEEQEQFIEMWEQEIDALRKEADKLKKAIKDAPDADTKKAAQEAYDAKNFHLDSQIMVTNYAQGGLKLLTPTHRWVMRKYWRLLKGEDKAYWEALNERDSDNEGGGGAAAGGAPAAAGERAEGDE
jgi:hypothetical protein